MRIVLVDLYTSGHHLSYIKIFSEAFKKKGFDVNVLIPECDEYDKLSLSKHSVVKGYKLYFYKKTLKKENKGRFSSRINLLQKWELIEKNICQYGIQVGIKDLIFFPYLDPFIGPYVSIRTLDKVFPYSWSGLIMNPQNSRIKMRYSFLRRGIFDPNNFFNSPNCKSILLFDSLIAITFNKKFKKKAIVIPDVIDISSPNFEYCVYKEIAKKSESKNVVSIVGSISKRKGILSFLRAIEGFESKNFLFVVAGKLDIDSFTKAELNYVSNVIETNKDKILFFEERIPSEADFNSIIFQSDIIFASYLDFTASSNLITKAAYFRKPIIVSKGFLMEEIIDKYRLGISINQENKQELNKALIEITSETFKKSYLNNKLIDEYIFEHSHDYLSECLVKVVS